MKKILGSIVVTVGLFVAPNANAILPVTDVALITATTAGDSAVVSAIGAHAGSDVAGHGLTNGTNVAGWAQRVADFVEEKVKWVEEKVHWLKNETELGQTVTTLLDTEEKIQTSIDKANGLRSIGSEYTHATLDIGDGHLPDDYQSGMANVKAGTSPVAGKTSLLDNFNQFAAYITGVAGINSDDEINDQIDRAALNRSMAEIAYAHGAARHKHINDMAAKIDTGALETKDIQDLQARIQLVQAEVQNEHTKVTAMLAMQGAQADVERLREKQARLDSLKMGPRDAVIAVVTGAAAWNM